MCSELENLERKKLISVDLTDYNSLGKQKILWLYSKVWAEWLAGGGCKVSGMSVGWAGNV